ncbi:MAG: hypothetical protein QXF80_06775 [Thermoplasmatales archaeon]
MTGITLTAVSGTVTVSTITLNNVTNLTLDKEINLTVMPIPTMNQPIILNYGGASIKLSITADLFSSADVNTLYSYFMDASGSIQVNIDLSLWAMGTVSGYCNSGNIQMVAGEPNHWTASLVYMIGQLM